MDALISIVGNKSDERLAELVARGKDAAIGHEVHPLGRDEEGDSADELYGVEDDVMLAVPWSLEAKTNAAVGKAGKAFFRTGWPGHVADELLGGSSPGARARVSR